MERQDVEERLNKALAALAKRDGYLLERDLILGSGLLGRFGSPKPKARSSEPNVSRECNSPMA